MTKAPKDPSDEVNNAFEKVFRETFQLKDHKGEDATRAVMGYGFHKGATFGEAIGARKERERILKLLDSGDIKELTDEYGWMSLREVRKFIEEQLK